MTIAELDRDTRPLAPFAAQVAAEDSSTVLTLRGEADYFTRPTVVGALALVISEHEGPVVVDLAETSFIDAGTLSALGDAARLLANRDRALTVRGASRMALRLFAILGLSDLIQNVPPQRERRPGAHAVANR